MLNHSTWGGDNDVGSFAQDILLIWQLHAANKQACEMEQVREAVGVRVSMVLSPPPPCWSTSEPLQETTKCVHTRFKSNASSKGHKLFLNLLCKFAAKAGIAGRGDISVKGREGGQGVERGEGLREGRAERGLHTQRHTETHADTQTVSCECGAKTTLSHRVGAITSAWNGLAFFSLLRRE